MTWKDWINKPEDILYNLMLVGLGFGAGKGIAWWKGIIWIAICIFGIVLMRLLDRWIDDTKIKQGENK